MENEQRFSQEQWVKMYAYLRTFPRLHTRDEAKCRRVVEAVYWVLRRKAPWRVLPPMYGHWNVVYQRFADWDEQGVWYKMLYYFAHAPNMSAIMIDSTILRAHACAAGALKKSTAIRTYKPEADPVEAFPPRCMVYATPWVGRSTSS